MSGHILHVAAEVDLFLTGRAETDVAVVGRLEVFPELRTLEPEGDGTVGDGGHGDWELGDGSWEPRLWEEPRKTTEGSPRGVAPSAGRQMPSNGRRMGDGIVRGVKA